MRKIFNVNFSMLAGPFKQTRVGGGGGGGGGHQAAASLNGLIKFYITGPRFQA
jgi:hypothetical protein